MKTMAVACDYCSGEGYVYAYIPSEEQGAGKLKVKKCTCNNCNGKGYTEYAAFSIEEANAILKHCELSTES